MEINIRVSIRTGDDMPPEDRYALEDKVVDALKNLGYTTDSITVRNERK